eukprot:GILI01004263.1.p1 GENE.GILI01004263.1~~GILI01004263.1.p1  ORF type:complete len:390 (-),score=71.17 GILI01004263.1:849-2018(-)
MNASVDASKTGAHIPQHLTLDNVSPSTRLLEKRRQMYEVQDALDQQKEEFARREENFRRKEEQLRKRDLELQEQLIKFNKFLQDNESKRSRAEKRFAEEYRQKKQKEQEIIDLEKRLEELRTQNFDLQKEVQKNSKYEEILESVKDANEDYSEIPELVNRFSTLEAANKDLRENQAYFEEQAEIMRAEFHQYTKERNNEILAFNNDIAMLQKKLEEAEGERLRQQGSSEELARKITDSTLQLGQILMAIENIYLRCLSKRPFLKARPDGLPAKEDNLDEYHRKAVEAKERLDVVGAYINDFQSIVDECPKELRHFKKAPPSPPSGATRPVVVAVGSTGQTSAAGTSGSNHSTQASVAGKGGATVVSTSNLNNTKQSLASLASSSISSTS